MSKQTFCQVTAHGLISTQYKQRESWIFTTFPKSSSVLLHIRLIANGNSQQTDLYFFPREMCFLTGSIIRTTGKHVLSNWKLRLLIFWHKQNFAVSELIRKLFCLILIPYHKAMVDVNNIAFVRITKRNVFAKHILTRQ